MTKSKKSFFILVAICMSISSVVAFTDCGDSSKNYCNVSITTLTANPAVFHGKVVFIHGYLNFIARGPYAGYWLSSDNYGIPYGNSLVLEFPEDAPQRKWIEDGEKYSVRGVFKDCRPRASYSQNCYFKIEPISESGIIEIMHMYVE